MFFTERLNPSTPGGYIQLKPFSNRWVVDFIKFLFEMFPFFILYSADFLDLFAAQSSNIVNRRWPRTQTNKKHVRQPTPNSQMNIQIVEILQFFKYFLAIDFRLLED